MTCGLLDQERGGESGVQMSPGGGLRGGRGQDDLVLQRPGDRGF